MIDHLQSGVVYNFGRVCMSVCQTINFESHDVESSFAHAVHLHGLRVEFVYEGYRVKVKVTGAKKGKKKIPVPAM